MSQRQTKATQAEKRVAFASLGYAGNWLVAACIQGSDCYWPALRPCDDGTIDDVLRVLVGERTGAVE